MSTDSDRNDISTEASVGEGESDNLGAEEGKGVPPTVPPTDREGTDGGDVLAEDPADQ